MLPYCMLHILRVSSRKRKDAGVVTRKVSLRKPPPTPTQSWFCWLTFVARSRLNWTKRRLLSFPIYLRLGNTNTTHRSTPYPAASWTNQRISNVFFANACLLALCIVNFHSWRRFSISRASNKQEQEQQKREVSYVFNQLLIDLHWRIW